MADRLGFVALYNAVMGRQGLSLPRHMIPVAMALEDKRIDKLLIILGPASSKSTTVDTLYPVWLLGCDPSQSILLVSAGEALVNSFTRAAVEIIENSPIYKAAFPNVKPQKQLGWSETRGYFVQRPNAGDAKPSLISVGIDSSQLTGLHAHTVILDDLHDAESSATKVTCDRVVDTYYNTLVHRDVPQGSRFIGIGRRWSEHDIYGHLINSGDWVSMVLPAERGEGVTNLWWDIQVPEGTECCFTEGYAEAQEQTEDHRAKALRPYKAYYGTDPEAKGFYWPDYPAIRKRCMAIKRGAPDTFQAIFQCNPGAREGSVFLEKDFRYFSHLVPAMTPQTMPEFLKRGRIVQSWDTGQTTGKDSDYSVCITAAMVPCQEYHRDETAELLGSCDPHYDSYILDVYRGKLEIGDLIKKIRELNNLWHPGRVCVEEKSSGIQVIQSLQNSSIPIFGVKANISKRARATESLGSGSWSVQGWFRQGRVLIWAEAPWAETYKVEMKNFTGDGSGKDDQVDATVHLVSYAITMGTGAPMMPTSFDIGPITKPSLSELASYDSRAAMLNNIDILLSQRDNAAIPELCATCTHRGPGNMCPIQQRRVSGIDTCSSWKAIVH